VRRRRRKHPGRRERRDGTGSANRPCTDTYARCAGYDDRRGDDDRSRDDDEPVEDDHRSSSDDDDCDDDGVDLSRPCDNGP